MLVVHGGWYGGRLALWGEDVSRGHSPASRGRAASSGAAPERHPFAASAAALAAALGAGGSGATGEIPGGEGIGGLSVAAGEPGTEGSGGLLATVAAVAARAEAAGATIRLPGSASRPLPSPESGLKGSVRGPRISTWLVPVLLLRPDAALALLEALPQPGEEDSGTASGPRETPGNGGDPAGNGGAASGHRGVTPGDGPEASGDAEETSWEPGLSLRYLAVVAEHARSLVRRGRILPQLVEEDGGHAARWRPVLIGADAAAFRDLAAAMPPVCRALPGERPAAEVLGEALEGLVDGAARAALPERLIVGARPGRKTALADRWLHALTAPDASLPGARPAEAAALGDALRGWSAAAHELDGPVRAWFRLVEPAGEDDPWKVEFGLAPAVAAEHAGTGGADGAGRTHGAGRASGEGGPGSGDAGEPDHLPADRIRVGERASWLPERPWEVLRAELARAVRLHPDLHGALRDPEPAVMEIDTARAFSFLRGGAPALAAAGHVVRLPEWAGRQGLGLKLTVRATEGRERAGLSDRVGFRLEAAVGGHTIGEEELSRLAGLRVPLARVGGRWVELDDRQLKAALEVVGRRGGGETTLGEMIREIAAGGEGDLPLVAVDADGPLGDLLSGEADRRLTPVATPRALRGTLRPYQERGLSWLSFLSGLGLGGVLADDMGLGKTVSALSLLLSERERAAGDAGGASGPAARNAEGPAGRVTGGERTAGDAEGQVTGDVGGAPGPTLLVCPMSLIGNWRKEAARFAPSLRVYVHHGGSRRRDDELPAAVRDADLVITTYGTALRDLGALAALRWERVICDEAQAIKNSAARQSRAVRAIPARTRLALTGTPVENRLSELWSIMEFCNPGLLGPARRFRERYQEPIETRRDEDAVAALRRATGPFVLRRLKTDRSIITDLPEKQEMKVWCTLTPEQAELYTAVVNDMMGRIGGSAGIERRGNVLAAMTKLKQICNHPAHLLRDGSRLAGRSGKLARLEELAGEILAEGDSALVFTQYAEFGALLRPYLAARLDRPVLWLHGGLSRGRREELVERFQRGDEPTLFLLSLKAAGTGLNLTAASHVIHVDRWWNPAVEDQATDRAFRIGQTRNVQVRKFICVDTLEERIDEMIERKRSLAESVVGTGEDWISELSTDQLRELFRLGPGAVS
ncbi:DEAD/DEAH box helicase [Streptosporangium pseudovulgare]|uniref:DEAD/DEAH box helicase n=1 Tax=Streptosporangium pseudovulgare TaxID=35765 RepID=UPI001E55A9EF|nr:DEAD/DEAH box helicase [Streptosporangium pseudovulgare]